MIYSLRSLVNSAHRRISETSDLGGWTIDIFLLETETRRHDAALVTRCLDQPHVTDSFALPHSKFKCVSLFHFKKAQQYYFVICVFRSLCTYTKMLCLRAPRAVCRGLYDASRALRATHRAPRTTRRAPRATRRAPCATRRASCDTRRAPCAMRRAPCAARCVPRTVHHALRAAQLFTSLLRASL